MYIVGTGNTGADMAMYLTGAGYLSLLIAITIAFKIPHKSFSVIPPNGLAA